MPRGSKRNRRTRPTATKRTSAHGESAASKQYRTSGKSYGYKYRIHGPTSPVIITRMDETS